MIKKCDFYEGRNLSVGFQLYPGSHHIQGVNLYKFKWKLNNCKTKGTKLQDAETWK